MQKLSANCFDEGIYDTLWIYDSLWYHVFSFFQVSKFFIDIDWKKHRRLLTFNTVSADFWQRLVFSAFGTLWRLPTWNEPNWTFCMRSSTGRCVGWGSGSAVLNWWWLCYVVPQHGFGIYKWKCVMHVMSLKEPEMKIQQILNVNEIWEPKCLWLSNNLTIPRPKPVLVFVLWAIWTGHRGWYSSLMF